MKSHNQHDSKQVLSIKDLNVRYGNETVIEDISFSLTEGEILAVMGPNGSGKTTLFKAILGSLPYNGKIILGPETKIGYVPQKIDLERNLPITVEEFLLLRVQNLKYGDVLSPETALGLVHMGAPFLHKKFSELSSGEFQRTLIAWALIGKPNLLLFDEPTSSIDVAGQETVYDLLHHLHDSEKFTLLLISHDLTVVYRYATKVLCLNHSQACFGIPKDVLTPTGLKRLYGSGNFYKHATV
ncbi:MAG: metal ABC transporter ATP-binding protein [Candidatus Colwellbacteria bacterium]|nr:metal ABC transporter ATP-binding protein [Candidatus Colwellbacteria bacterium]MBI3274288.1 metal ABC transporter ATP-binding protein [Candidatus Colwellbacteria bacterium]